MAAPPGVPPGVPGPFTTSGPGLPPHGAAAVAHYRVALGMGLGSVGDYQQALDESYRQSTHPLPSQEPMMHPPAAIAGPAPGQFGILAPTPVPDVGETVFAPGAMHQVVERSHGQLSSRIVANPPDLQAWRERLFNVDEMIVLTHEQFETYFPHVDNVYSHRSTQRYKRKPFVSHYWDCRMKGRPPGTPKSDDPNKKKRKRNARERDLCDVKIKITEYFPGAQIQFEDDATQQGIFPTNPLAQNIVGAGQRLWTIQRVNGNGGNGKGDGVAGPHKHSLAKSDEIKKNSVQRLMAKQEKETKKTQKPALRKATGAALATVKKHSKDSDLKLYAACFCPFSQRVWIALEAKGLAYQYCEIDPYRKPTPTALLEANPRGLVPAIRQDDWACAESGIILEYLEDLDRSVPLYPTDPRLRANCRLWVDHINGRIVPAFYAVLQNQDPTFQNDLAERLQSAIQSLVQAADEHGPFFLGASLCLVDIHFTPFALRLSRVLKWPGPTPGARWQRWLEAMEVNEHVRATTSGEELYVETTEVLSRYTAVQG
ncbi:Fc.00g069280.m01.CDS01 [Cosmosporella sp. VM-42]